MGANGKSGQSRGAPRRVCQFQFIEWLNVLDVAAAMRSSVVAHPRAQADAVTVCAVAVLLVRMRRWCIKLPVPLLLPGCDSVLVR